MKKLLTTTLALSFIINLSAQKPILDTAALNHWPSLTHERAISNDGKYFMYGIDNVPMGDQTLVVKSTENSWQKEFVGIGTGFFSGDNKEFIYQNGDTLFFLELGKDKVRQMTGVASFAQPQNSKGQWLVYQLNNADKEQVIEDLISKKEQHFKGVTGYLFDEGIKKVLMTTADELEWAGLTTGSDNETSTIWSKKEHPGLTLSGYIIDKSGTQVCFITSETTADRTSNKIWYYKEGMDRAEVKVTDASEGIPNDLKLAAFGIQFSGDGRNIFFRLTTPPPLKQPADFVSVDVWSWQDSMLQASQLFSNRLGPTTYVSVLPTNGNKVIRLEQANEGIIVKQDQGNYIVVQHNNNPGDRFWLAPKINCYYYLVSTKDGSRILLNLIVGKASPEIHFSPDGKYLVYYDPGQQGNYFSYELGSNIERKISSHIPNGSLSWKDGFRYLSNNQKDTNNYDAVGLLGWLSQQDALLVYDNFDIWELSLSGTQKPVNVTGEYGRGHYARLRMLDDLNPDEKIFREGDNILFRAFNTKNKYNGFCRLSLAGQYNLEELSMGPQDGFRDGFETSQNPLDFNNTGVAGMPPLKAENANSWIVLRSTLSEAPNYFLTHDFKTFEPLTDQQPQKNYNWLTAELINWQQRDGIITQGILSKPENFDPNKKYPVIIYYYEQFSHRLFEFPQPEYTSDAHINIPWFVSRGYLVFTPDIIYHQYLTLTSANVTVESAAKMLSKLSYVDSKKLGIAGHSSAGAETNYIVTHSHLFAAALSGAAGHDGVDLISNSLTIGGWSETNGQVLFENELGTTLWQRPDLWIKNSPVYHADQVTTPFLMFYNKQDLDWLRALEFFIALRRLGKPTWMLQYDHGGHAVVLPEDKRDFTIRVTQFFDHYLKDSPSPVWMTKGIPARLKGVDNGLELDESNKQ